MSNKRNLRLSEAYLRELSAILLNRVHDPRLKGVYVTQVQFTPDLKLAKVYFNVSEGRIREAEILDGFEQCRGFIKKEISKEINIKNTPDLKFYYDNLEEEQNRIDQLFDQIEKKRHVTS